MRDGWTDRLKPIYHPTTSLYYDMCDLYLWTFDLSIWKSFCEIALSRIITGLIDHKSTLIQVMASCHQAPTHYLNQCWLRSMTRYSVTRPQRFNLWNAFIIKMELLSSLFLMTYILHGVCSVAMSDEELTFCFTFWKSKTRTCGTLWITYNR